MGPMSMAAPFTGFRQRCKKQKVTEPLTRMFLERNSQMRQIQIPYRNACVINISVTRPGREQSAAGRGAGAREEGAAALSWAQPPSS